MVLFVEFVETVLHRYTSDDSRGHSAVSQKQAEKERFRGILVVSGREEAKQRIPL